MFSKNFPKCTSNFIIMIATFYYLRPPSNNILHYSHPQKEEKST